MVCGIAVVAGEHGVRARVQLLDGFEPRETQGFAREMTISATTARTANTSRYSQGWRCD
jgi:hypothetical protein